MKEGGLPETWDTTLTQLAVPESQLRDDFERRFGPPTEFIPSEAVDSMPVGIWTISRPRRSPWLTFLAGVIVGGLVFAAGFLSMALR